MFIMSILRIFYYNVNFINKNKTPEIESMRVTFTSGIVHTCEKPLEVLSLISVYIKNFYNMMF